MRMQQLTERVWLFPKEDERDRPVLGYVRGDRWSLAVDAGHSDAHVEDFYHALGEEGLPLPELTVLTHWHWDHTFGLHAIQGLSVANVLTNEHLRDYRDMIERNGADVFLDQYESIRVEYAGNRPVKIVTSDLEFSGEMMFDAGSCRIRVFQADAPHTDDSTFIEVIDDGVLFIGDAILGDFPSGRKDRRLCWSLMDTIKSSDAHSCVFGHWGAMSKKEALAGLGG